MVHKEEKNSQKVGKSFSHAWTDFPKKLAILRNYGWPRRSFLLQVRVVFCFILLIFGRLVNVALPLYMDGLTHSEHFNYNLIYMMVFLKFLQGGGSMGGFLSTLRIYLWIPIRQYTYRELEVALFSHMHSLPMKWHVHRQIGSVLKVANRGTNSVSDILNLFLFNILPISLDFIIAVGFFSSTFSIYFGVIVFGTLVAHLVMNITFTEWRTRFRREMNTRENQIGAIGTDSLLNYEIVKYYGNEEFEVGRYRKAIEQYQLADWKNDASLAIQKVLQHGIIGLGLLFGACLAAYLITEKKTLSVGDYVLFTTYIWQLYTPLNVFAKHYRTVQKAFIDMENMISLFDEEPEAWDSPDAKEYIHKDGNITIDNLVFGYNDDENVLNEVSFQAKKGQNVALVGVSGSGKTSILRLLYRLYNFSKGSVKIDGTDIRHIKTKSLRKEIGIVPQDTVLFNETIRFNIRYGNLKATDQEVEEAAKAAMIHDKIISLPEGYDTVVGDRGMKLSGGEKQRLSVARTILKKPKFIFLDEATSALDIHTERAVQRCLEQLCDGRTSLVVAHRLSTVIGADCILVMDKGKVIEKGTHAELLALEGPYYKMWQTQNVQSSPN